MAGIDDVTAVVVALRRSERLRTCIDALLTEVAGPERIICVINEPGPSGGLDETPGVRYLEPGVNLGWAGGAHYARRRVDTPLLWLIQDDVVVRPGALSALIARLDADADLAAVRPLEVDESGVIHRGRCGALLDEKGQWRDFLPPEATPATRFVADVEPDFLLSSASLVRLTAWDQVGGFNPWLYPVNLVDMDLGLALRSKGWRLKNHPGAEMFHDGHASTPSLFSRFTFARNEIIFQAAWFPGFVPPPGERAEYLSEECLAEAAGWHDRPAPFDDAELHRIAGVAAADSYVRFARYAQREIDRLEREAGREREAAIIAQHEAGEFIAGIERHRDDLIERLAETDTRAAGERTMLISRISELDAERSAMVRTKAWRAHLLVQRLKAGIRARPRRGRT
jgi:GT2 family glycosyltransferase